MNLPPDQELVTRAISDALRENGHSAAAEAVAGLVGAGWGVNLLPGEQHAVPFRLEGRRQLLPSRQRLRRYAATISWGLVSVVDLLACGMGTGAGRLAWATGAPWVRAALLLAALGGLVIIARRVSLALARIADERERLCPALVHGEALGPSRRWAIWISTLTIGCLVSFLLNEHRPETPGIGELVPARPLDVAVVLLGLVLVAPFVRDLRAGIVTRRRPWSSPVCPPRPTREEPDLVGAILRLSPPLLWAFLIAFAMYVTTFGVGLRHPTRLLGGFGVLGVYVAGLLAAPALLESLDRADPQRWYARRRVVAIRLRAGLAQAQKLLITAQILSLGGALGASASGSQRAASGAVLFAAFWADASALGIMITRMLWFWSESDQGPIGTEVLTRYRRWLTMCAGVALTGGSLLSLCAILIG